MITIVGISGSLRKDSYNAGLLRASVDAVPGGFAEFVGKMKS